MKVPFFVPDVGEAEKQALLDVIDSEWITMGPRVEELERRFADVVGTKHAVAVNSCTAALHLANVCLDLAAGDEVIVPSLTFAATANAVVFTGATPVFADIKSADDWTLSPEHVAAQITPQTKAVIAMHYAGYPCDMAALQAVCDSHGVRLLEDACHGLGGSLDGKPMGSLSEIGCFSFYSNKVITTAEGGMLTTDSDEIALRTRRLRSHGMTRTAIDRIRGAMTYDITEVGYNYRMDDIRGALGLVQLAKLPGYIDKRQKLVDYYHSRLDTITGITCPRHGSRGVPAHYILPVRVDPGVDRDAIRTSMAAAGIQTSMHYPPVHYFGHYATRSWELPNTELIGDVALSLPLYPHLTFEQIDQVCEALSAAL